MRLINEYQIKYVNHLLGSEGLVLRGDSKRGDSPLLKIYSKDNLDLVLRIETGFELENMVSNPNEGAKERIDIHFGTDNLKNLFSDLNYYAQVNKLVMDNKSTQVYNPTGTEHSNGLPLGKVQTITSIPVEGNVYYPTLSKVANFSMMYVDAENYINKERYHLGARTKTIDMKSSNRLIEFTIDSAYVYRFVKSIELTDILLN